MLEERGTRAPGVGWLLVDYRGYGASDGSPSEAALVADALRWHDYAVSRSASEEHLSCSAAAWAAAWRCSSPRNARSPASILVAPFDSLVEVGKRHYPFLPVDWMLKHRFDSVALRAEDRGAAAVHRRRAATRSFRRRTPKRLYDAWGGAEALDRCSRAPATTAPTRTPAILAEHPRRFWQ